MTSLNAFFSKDDSGKPDAIHIATDGQTYINDDPLGAEVQKVALLANLPAVIAVRGGYMMLPSIIATVSKNVTTFDELIAACPDLLKAICHRYWELAEKSGDKSPRRAQFIIAGFSSERDQLEAYHISSFAWDGIPAWSPFKIPNVLMTPCNSSFLEKLGEIYAEDLRDHPEAMAIHVMETQRGHLFEHIEDGQPAQGGDIAAGKFCQLTTLTRAGISTQILKRWE